MRRKAVLPITKSPPGTNHGRSSLPYVDTNTKTPKRKDNGMAMSVEQMADELAIGRNVAYQLIKQPGFPAFMIGRRVLINRKGLQLWIDKQCESGADISVYIEAETHKHIEK